MAAAVLCAWVALPAAAGTRDETVRFIPSQSADVAGYLLSIGPSPGASTVQIDLGLPPVQAGTASSVVAIDDGIDNYMTLRAYSSAGLYSLDSNEILVPKVTTTPPPTTPPPPGSPTYGVTSINGVSSVLSGLVQVEALVAPGTESVDRFEIEIMVVDQLHQRRIKQNFFYV